MKKIIYILLFLPVLTYGQSNRVKIIQDNTGVFRGSVPPSDTSLTWRNTTDGQSYFWSVENQAWTVVKFNYDFPIYTSILGAEIPAGAIARDKYRKFWIQTDTITGFPVDSIWTIPLASGYGYAIDERLINEQVIEITEDMIGDTTQNNYILSKSSSTALRAAQAGKSTQIELPAKNISYTNTWTVRGVYSGTSVSIKGSKRSNNGTGGTILAYTGNDSTSLYISDMGYSRISNFTISGNSKYIVYLDTFIFKTQFDNVAFGAVDSTTEALVEMNRYTNSQISETYFSQCRFAGPGGGGNLNPGDQYVERGISGGLANNKDVYISECEFLNIDTAILYRAGGILDIRKNNFANNYVDISAGNNQVFCTGNYSEAARRFYTSSIYSGTSVQTLEGNYWAGQPVNNIVIWGGGYLSLMNNSFDGSTDSLNRVKWDIPDNLTILTTGSNNSRKILSIGNFFKNCSNSAGEKWLINGSDIEPTNVSKSVRSWSNRGGENNSSGIYLEDYFSFWDSQANGIVYQGSGFNSVGTNVLLNNANMSIQNWGSGYGLAVGSSSTITPAFFSGLNGSIAVGVNGRAQVNLNSASGQVPRINLSENGTTYLYIGQTFTTQPTVTANVNHLTVFVDGNNDGVGNLYFRKGSINGRVTDGTGLALLTNSGNFGIGTFTSVTERLEVSGNCVIDGTIYLNTSKTVGIFTGTGDPEGAVTASVGSTFHRTDGGASTTLYVKESGTGNTGWVAK